MSFKITNGSLDGYCNDMFDAFVDTAFELSGNPHLQLSMPRFRSKTPSGNYEIWVSRILETLKTTDASKIHDYIFIKLRNPRGIHYKKCAQAASFYRSLLPKFKELEGSAVGYYSDRCHDMIQALEKCSSQKRNFRIIE